MSQPAASPAPKKILPSQILKVSRYEELPGQVYRSPDCRTFYWREDDHSDFEVIQRQCDCSNHPILLNLDKPDLWYEVKNETVPELVWVEREEDVPAGIYLTEEGQVMARADPAGDYKTVEFDLFQGTDADGCLVLGQGVASLEVVARVDGKLYRIPLELLPEQEGEN